MPSNKLLGTIFIGKVKNILRDSNAVIKEVTENKTLEDPIMSDVVLSEKAAAYDKILKEYKDYREKKKASNEEE